MGEVDQMLTAPEARAALSYCQDTGRFTWLANRKRSLIGVRAGSKCGGGYRTVCVKGKQYFEHRLAWLLVYGAWPAKQIDHINGVRDDNRLANLREASVAENTWNRKRGITNVTGYKGVSWHRGMKKYRSQITHQRRMYVLGYFESPADAHAAYVAAARALRGEFANSGG